MKFSFVNSVRLPFAIVALIVACLLADTAFSQTPFYKGKTIRVIQGAAAGGALDVRVRAVIPFLEKYIPGNPNVITEYMPGAGGGKVAGYIYNAAKPDGLTIGEAGSGFVSNAVLGQSEVTYDIDKFVYIGSADTSAHYIFFTRKQAGLTSLEKLRSHSGLRIGGQTVGQSPYLRARFFAYLIGFKEPRFVTGYSGPEVDLAMQRGEIDARNNPAQAIMMRTPDWVEKSLMDFHAGFEVPVGNKHARFAHLQDLATFTRTEKERKLLAMLRSLTLTGSPYFLPPGTPHNLVRILQDAMRKTFEDKEFHSEFEKKTGDSATPLLGEALQKVIKELPRDPEVVTLFKTIAGPDPLPAR
jgi:tripartite-type tricarboxylate transporter receptor subunit TctC